MIEHGCVEGVFVTRICSGIGCTRRSGGREILVQGNGSGSGKVCMSSFVPGLMRRRIVCRTVRDCGWETENESMSMILIWSESAGPCRSNMNENWPSPSQRLDQQAAAQAVLVWGDS